MIQARTASHTSSPTHPLAGFMHSVSEMAVDIIEVSELQVQLAKADARLAAQRSVLASVIVIAGACSMLASLPLLALGICSFLVAQFGWEPWQAQILIGILLILVSVGLIALGVYRLRTAMRAFGRSSSELSNNVKWIKQLVRGLQKSSNE